MTYGQNILTDDWDIVGGHMSGSTLVLEAGGYARQVVDIEKVPDKFLLGVTSTRYAARYTPVDIVRINITYADESLSSLLAPLRESVELTTKSAACTNFVVTIVASAATEISLIELKPAVIQIVGNNGETMIDEYGIDPRFIKAFKNAIWNSSFERFNADSKIPDFWSGGEATDTSAFADTHSMKLVISEVSEIVPNVGAEAPRPDPAWWDNKTTRVSFFKKGGDVQVAIFAEYDWSPYELTWEDGTKANWYNTGVSTNWDTGKYTFSFTPTKTGRIWLRFSNIGSSAAYIDAVQMEPDFNGKYPSFYTNGPYSISAAEVPMSDTWLEFVNAPYSQSIGVEFTHEYTYPPVITANLIRNVNAANAGSAFGNHNISPNIDLIIEEVSSVLYYTGALITWGGSAPAAIDDAFVSIQIVGRR